MRVLVDLTNSPHVPFFAPLVALLEARGHEVHVVARRFAQTVELAERTGLRATTLGQHGGSSRGRKGLQAGRRVGALLAHARTISRERGMLDVAMSHGSTDLPIVARALGVPHVTAFDYEWAATMHHLNCRLSWRVVVPDAIPLERLDRYGAAGRITTYPGLKEEYYLDTAALDGGIRASLGIAAEAPLAVLRPPAGFALYHRGIDNDLFDGVLDRLRAQAGARVVVLARTPQQRGAILQRVAGDAAVIVPEHALDGASLIAAADVVVSAGGTMNREAAALGVPVYTVFAGRMGGVDERLLAEGRLRQLTSVDDVHLERSTSTRSRMRAPVMRAPADLLDRMLTGLAPVTRST